MRSPALEAEARQLSSVAFRWIAAATLAVVLVTGHVPGFNLLLIAALATVTADTRHILTLKNFFLIYVVVLFGIGVAVLHLSDTDVFGDVIWYLAAFLAGYALASLRRTGPTPQGRAHRAGRTSRRANRPGVAGRGPLHISSVQVALKALVVLNMMFLAWQLNRYGFVGFYRGQALLDQFLSYGKANAGAGLEQIIRFLLKFSAIALVVLYAQGCFETRTKIRYVYPVGVLVVLPILLLRRYDAIGGALTVLAVYVCDRRMGAGAQTEALSRRASLIARRAAIARTLMVVAAMVFSFVAAYAIGVLRNNSLAPTSTGGPALILTSELYPVQAYGEIRSNLDRLGRPGAKTIVGPLLLKVVPRAWLPGKPLNSGGYYMSVLHPREFEAGFAVPPTFFGDTLLSFGFSGAVLACFALGFVLARLDMAFRRRVVRRIPLFLIFFASLYPLLREPLSESLAALSLTLAVWFLGNRMFRGSRILARPVRRAAVPSLRGVVT